LHHKAGRFRINAACCRRTQSGQRSSRESRPQPRCPIALVAQSLQALPPHYACHAAAHGPMLQKGPCTTISILTM
jgi:hypothetical protein